MQDHCGVLNSDERMKIIEQENELVAVLVDIENDKNEVKKEAKAKREAEERELQARRVEAVRVVAVKESQGLVTCKQLLVDILGRRKTH